MGWPFLICLAKEMQHIIFYAQVHACSPSYTDEEDIAVDSKTVCLWLVDHSFDRAIKTLCCL